MSSINIESLLQPVSEEHPCGEDLEYDPVYQEMEQAAEGRPDQQIGDTVVEAEEPDWREVNKKALDLLARSKDLRVLTYMARSLTRCEGLVGLSQVLTLLQGYLEQYWDTVHPQLDPDDDNDPTMRVNAIASLCDPETMLRDIHEAPLVDSRVLGSFSFKDIQIATGKLPAPKNADTPPAEMSAIQAAFMDVEPAELQATGDAVEQAIESAAKIEALLTERLGAAQAPNLEALRKALRELQPTLAEQLSRRGLTTTASAAAPGEAAAAPPPPPPDQINNREDVLRMLDKICEYFEQHEPSSPVPILLHRAKGLTKKDFVEILRDLVPESVKQFEKVHVTGDDK